MTKPYIFVHINKCGGSSVKKALTGTVDHRHQPINCIRMNTDPTQYREAFKFTIIRNPFARLVSMYHYRLKTGQIEDIKFKEWFYLAVVDKELPFYNNPIMFAPCYEWMVDLGTIQMDYIAKLETINIGWKELQHELGIKTPLPKLNTTSHGDPAVYYNSEMQRLTRRIYKPDFRFYD